MAILPDGAYVCYFVLHIVITVLIDAAIALPEQYQLPLQKQLLAYHVRTNSDLLIVDSPVWLRSFVWLEILLQLPFFFWAAADLLRGRKRVWPAIVAYGVEASTTTYACLAEVVFMDASPEIKRNLLGLYVPTLALPLVMAIDFGRRIASELTQKQKTE